MENLILCIAIIGVVAGIAICIQDKLERDLGDTLNYKNNEDDIYSPSTPNKNNCNSKEGSSNTVTKNNNNEVSNIGNIPHKLPSNGELDEYTSEEKREDLSGKPDNKENLPSLKDPGPRTHTQGKKTISTTREGASSKNKIESENFPYLTEKIKDPFPLPRSGKITCPKCGRELNPSNKCNFFDYLMECPECGNIFSKGHKEGQFSPSKKNIPPKKQKILFKCYLCGKSTTVKWELTAILTNDGVKYVCKKCWEDLANSESPISSELENLSLESIIGKRGI